jgi:hypothetical protein
MWACMVIWDVVMNGAEWWDVAGDGVQVGEGAGHNALAADGVW